MSIYKDVGMSIPKFNTAFKEKHSRLGKVKISKKNKFNPYYPSLTIEYGGNTMSLDCYPGCCGKSILNGMYSFNKPHVKSSIKVARKIAEEMGFASMEYSCIASQLNIVKVLKASSKFRKVSSVKGRTGNVIHTYVYDIKKIEK